MQISHQNRTATGRYCNHHHLKYYNRFRFHDGISLGKSKICEEGHWINIIWMRLALNWNTRNVRWDWLQTWEKISLISLYIDMSMFDFFQIFTSDIKLTWSCETQFRYSPLSLWFEDIEKKNYWIILINDHVVKIKLNSLPPFEKEEFSVHLLFWSLSEIHEKIVFVSTPRWIRNVMSFRD